MAIEGYSYHQIRKLLKIFHGFVSKWKNQALFQGVESLRLQYKGTQGYLKPGAKLEVINYLKTQEYLRLSDLKIYL